MIDEKTKKLFNGEPIFSEDNRISYKLDKQGSLLFNCADDVTEEEKFNFTVEALTNLGVDPEEAEKIAREN